MTIFARHAGLLDDIFGDEVAGTLLGDLKTRLRVTSESDLNKRIASKGDAASLGRIENMEFENIQFSTLRDDGFYDLHFGIQCPR